MYNIFKEDQSLVNKFTQQLLHVYYMSGTVLDALYAAVNKIKKKKSLLTLGLKYGCQWNDSPHVSRLFRPWTHGLHKEILICLRLEITWIPSTSVIQLCLRPASKVSPTPCLYIICSITLTYEKNIVHITSVLQRMRRTCAGEWLRTGESEYLIQGQK